jgi:hypothetical protein
MRQRPARGALRRLSVDARFAGGAYGARFPVAEMATLVAQRVGLELDPIYTARAFAKTLELGRFDGYSEREWPAGRHSPRELARSGEPLRVLYWHTLSAVPTGMLRRGAMDLPPVLQGLFTSV